MFETILNGKSAIVVAVLLSLIFLFFILFLLFFCLGTALVVTVAELETMSSPSPKITPKAYTKETPVTPIQIAVPFDII